MAVGVPSRGGYLGLPPREIVTGTSSRERSAGGVACGPGECIVREQRALEFRRNRAAFALLLLMNAKKRNRSMESVLLGHVSLSPGESRE